MTEFVLCIIIARRSSKGRRIGIEENSVLQELIAILPEWFALCARDLPWRRDREPYHVWLSEIMLQQTRVEAVKAYYTRFLEAVPDLDALAACDPELLHKLWEGLGYYSRVRNLQAAARRIQEEYHSVFPRSLEAVRALKGVGDYTAGAICSICFDLPTPAVDGNVLRVLSRLREDDRCTDDAAVRREIRSELAAVYPLSGAGTITQALMELGATVCVPNGTPHCEQCPMAKRCAAHKNGSWTRYPVRAEKKARRSELLTVFVLNCGGTYAIRKRPETGLLAGLWEFPNVPGHLPLQEALDTAERWGVRPNAPEQIRVRTHIFTHIRWEMRCYYLRCSERAAGFVWAQPNELEQVYALPTAFRMFRENGAADTID